MYLVKQDPLWFAHRQTTEVVIIEKFYQSLEKSALTITAEEQVLGIRSTEAGIYHTR